MYRPEMNRLFYSSHIVAICPFVFYSNKKEEGKEKVPVHSKAHNFRATFASYEMLLSVPETG